MLDMIRKVASGDLPAPPVAELIGFSLREAQPGLAVIDFEADHRLILRKLFLGRQRRQQGGHASHYRGGVTSIRRMVAGRIGGILHSNSDRAAAFDRSYFTARLG